MIQMIIWIYFILLFCKYITILSYDYNSPILPHDFDSLVSSNPYISSLFQDSLNNSTEFRYQPNKIAKKIPRHMWISFYSIPMNLSMMSDHVRTSVLNYPLDGWNVHLLGHEEQYEFMKTYYQNTSLLWAFEHIHSNAGAAMSDIWRYCFNISYILYYYYSFYLLDMPYSTHLVGFIWMMIVI